MQASSMDKHACKTSMSGQLRHVLQLGPLVHTLPVSAFLDMWLGTEAHAAWEAVEPGGELGGLARGHRC